jgi:hypothetical protein
MSAEGENSPIDLLISSSKQLFTPEKLVADVAMDLIKDEIRHHLEEKIRKDPGLSKEIKDAVKELLEARALEYSALLRLTATIARLGIVAVPEEMKMRFAREMAELMGRELGAMVEKTL